MESDDFIKIGLPILTFFLGFISSRLTMTKKERADHQIKLAENAKNLSKELEQAYERYSKAIVLLSEKSVPDINDFHEITISGEAYFSQLKTICDSVLSKSIELKAVENSLLTHIKDAAKTDIIEHYETLQSISEKLEFEFKGVAKLENYKSIHLVLEKYLDKNEFKEIEENWLSIENHSKN